MLTFGKLKLTLQKFKYILASLKPRNGYACNRTSPLLGFSLRGGMLSLQKCALIWNCNYSCWSSLVHIITWDWILGFLIAKIRSWSKFASAVFSDPDWNIDRPSAPNGQHQEEVGHQNLSCHWKRLTWLQAGRKNICCKFALAVLLTIISKNRSVINLEASC